MGIALSKEFLDALGQRESGGNYLAKNSAGFLGKYQLGELAMIDSGYYTKDSTKGVNDWVGTWTGKDGIYSVSAFLNSATAQENAINTYMNVQWGYIKYYGLDQYLGQTINGVVMTQTSLLAGAHLVGVGELKTYLQSNGATDPRDGNKTPISSYIKQFNSYASITPIVSQNKVEASFSTDGLVCTVITKDANGNIIDTNIRTYLDNQQATLMVDKYIKYALGTTTTTTVNYNPNDPNGACTFSTIVTSTNSATPVSTITGSVNGDGATTEMISGNGAVSSTSNAIICIAAGSSATITGTGNTISVGVGTSLTVNSGTGSNAINEDNNRFNRYAANDSLPMTALRHEAVAA